MNNYQNIVKFYIETIHRQQIIIDTLLNFHLYAQCHAKFENITIEFLEKLRVQNALRKRIELLSFLDGYCLLE